MQPWGILFVCSMLGAGCHQVFSYEPQQGFTKPPDASFDVGVSPDQSIPVDGPSVVPDQPATVPSLSCSSDVKRLVSDVELAEPAISPDGLRLYATTFKDNGITYVTTRATPGEPFGPWSIDDGFPAGIADPSIFDYQATRYLIAATRKRPRKLQAYAFLDGAWEYQMDHVVTLEQNPILQDTDGPKVYLRGVAPVLLLNTEDEDGNTAILVAGMAGLPFSWVARTIPALSSPLGGDDPTIDPQAQVIVFGRVAGQDFSDLWYALKLSADNTDYSEPSLLEGINTQYNEYAAELWRASETDNLELFFGSDRHDGATYNVYQTHCTLK